MGKLDIVMLSHSTFIRRSIWIACSLIVFICFSQTGLAQYVVISEYQNVVSVAEGEYTELLVVVDKVDLVGYTLRDNSASGIWQGGIKFKDIPLWKNLRKGTVIVIGHRNVPNSVIGDLNASDGSIVAGAVDVNLFEKVLFGATDWNQDALSIAQTSDMIQLLDPLNNPHYTLGHGTATYRGNYFDPIIATKLFHEISGITGSVYVYPGLSLADYDLPNPGNAKTKHTAFLSPSFPNTPSLAPAATDLNQQYWRDIRAPKWPFPVLTGVVNQASISLSWNQAEDLYPADNYQGYLLIRGTTVLNAFPQDGKTYSVGESVGDWEVVANLTGTTNTTFVDLKPMDCGDTTYYRVYAYRYSAPNIAIDSIYCAQFPFLAKGRSYNETTFGTFFASRPVPATPSITALGTTTICEGTDVTLKVLTSYQNGTGYQWFKDNAPISGANSSEYKAGSAGTYKLRINSVNGCTQESLPITVSILPKPNAVITPAKEVRICSGDSVTLNASPSATAYAWLYNGTAVQNTSATLTASKAGTYKVIVTDDKGCIDTSDATTIVLRSVAISFPDPSINFGNLDGCKSSTSASNMIRNTGSDTAIITKIDVPNGFQYVSPQLPIVLPPGKTATLTFAFTPLQPGETKGNAILQTSSCAALTTLNLRGFKEQASVSQSASNIDYGITFVCDIKPKDTIIVIDNKGNSTLTITKALIQSPFQIVSPSTFPLIIQPGTKSSITIQYSPATIENIYAQTLLLPYSSGTCFDTLRVTLNGEVQLPKFDIPANDLNISPLSGCTISRDSIFPITNSGKTELRINAQPTAGLTILTPLPIVIKPGETVMISVRVEPPTDGVYKGYITFTSEQCAVKKDYVIRTTKESASYTFSKDTHQFKSLVRCDKVDLLKDSILIKASALGISGEAQLSDVQITGPFTTTLVKGDKTTGGARDFIITFIPNADGVFNGKLQATFEPCSIIKTIDLSGALSTTSFAVDQNVISFPKTDSGIVDQKTFTFTNTGKEVVRIRSVSGFTIPFNYSSSKPLMTDITSGETVTFTVSYSPFGNSNDSIQIILDIDAGICSKQIALAITGTGNQPRPKDVNGSFDLTGENTSAEPGQIIKIPFIINSTNMREMNISAVTINIAYNRTLLLPKKLIMLQSGISGTMSENTPGILTITTKANDTNSRILTGNYFDIECMALLGDAMSTPLTITNQAISKLTTGTCTMSVNTPIFSLMDVCNLPNRLVKVSGQLSLAKKQHALSIDIISQDRTILQLYALDGSLIQTMVDGSLTSGNHELPLPVDLPSGVYLAILRSGPHIRTLSFGHVQ